jgi:hypothetical protein
MSAVQAIPITKSWQLLLIAHQTDLSGEEVDGDAQRNGRLRELGKREPALMSPTRLSRN